MNKVLYTDLVREPLRKVVERAEKEINEKCEVYAIEVIMKDGIPGLSRDDVILTWMFLSMHPNYVELRVSKGLPVGHGKLLARFCRELMSDDMIAEVSEKIINEAKTP